MKRFLNWLADKISPERASPKVARYRPTDTPSQSKKPAPSKATKPKQQANPDYVEFDGSIEGEDNSAGPRKNAVRRSKFVRENAGTHDTLSIVDESGGAHSDNHDEEGIDPYNTGRFDRSKNWDKRFRKD